MLPKVASQILHHTSRAVAAVQNQTGHTIRNVLQSGPTNLGQLNGTSSSGSGWNGSGPSSGGAKFHSSSSRFHTSYTGAGRAVTQADASASYNDNLDTSDEGFEIVPAKHDPPSSRSRRKVRSNSLSFTLQAQKEHEAKSILQAVQLHVRARHAFALSQQSASPDVALLTDTATSTNVALEAPEEPTDRQDESKYATLNEACRSGDVSAVQREIDALRSSQNPTTSMYNAMLVALRDVRPPGGSLNSIMDIYNEMSARSILPNYKTYCTLILAFTDRDTEVDRSIRSLEIRRRRNELFMAPDDPEERVEAEHIARLRSENNFSSAVTLFQTLCDLGLLKRKSSLNVQIYQALLRSCVHHSDVDTAIRIFSYLEKTPGLALSAMVFADMISIYIKRKDLAGAEEVFEEYKSAAQAGRLYWSDVALSREAHMVVWNRMVHGFISCGQPDSGLKLLEQMMDSSPGAAFGQADIPPPSASTFTSIISGFCQAGDVSSALTWFDRLLQQKDLSDHPLGATVVPTKPDPATWFAMFDGLAAAGMVHDLNRLVKVAQDQGIRLSFWTRLEVVHANLTHFDANPGADREDVIKTLGFLVNVLAHGSSPRTSSSSGLSFAAYQQLIQRYLNLKDIDGALDVAELCIQMGRESLAEREATTSLSPNGVHYWRKGLRKVVHSLTPLFVGEDAAPLDLKQSLRFGALSSSVDLSPALSALACLRAYARVQGKPEELSLSLSDWNLMFIAALHAERLDTSSIEEPLVPLETILMDFSQSSVQFTELLYIVQERIVNHLVRNHGIDQAKTILSSVSEDAVSMADRLIAQMNAQTEMKSPDYEPQSSGPNPSVRVDFAHSRFVDEYLPSRADLSPLVGYRRVIAGIKSGVYPTPEVLGRLINAMGRLGEVKKVRSLYDRAQTVLATLNHDKQWQSLGWFQVEDQMIIALAHAGDADAAHVHRSRILAQGGTPSADAYGALIQRVKDTTDDTANAMNLFQEARSRGVAPNIFLYNTVISKLAKARKVDHALELFQEMKEAGFRPTSVTYGAVIAACCRVGDAQSAEILFQEMSSQPNFKPRVPPFNTMMQLYTHTKPDRERVLYYYSALKRANVQPTAHTYKLLIDAYGTIEPIDVDAMEDTFRTLEADKRVSVQGTHWAALINAYGCVKKDLEKAISVFESIATHSPSVAAQLPDAICFEALFNVLVTLRQTDQIPHYLDQLNTRRIHMTAYIANLVIKGYAAAGNIEQARALFEGLIDPPEGIAAPNNHAVHDSTPKSVPPNAPVYREPSTWEAMIRAELGNGDRDRALALLERLQSRRFPPAVYNRISGILSADPATIWDSQGSPQSPISE